MDASFYCLPLPEELRSAVLAHLDEHGGKATVEWLGLSASTLTRVLLRNSVTGETRSKIWRKVHARNLSLLSERGKMVYRVAQ